MSSDDHSLHPIKVYLRNQWTRDVLYCPVCKAAFERRVIIGGIPRGEEPPDCPAVKRAAKKLKEAEPGYRKPETEPELTGRERKEQEVPFGPGHAAYVKDWMHQKREPDVEVNPKDER